jgi:hypothetical protein
LDRYWDLYSIDGSFGKTNLIEHQIYTEDLPSIKTRQRPINPGLEKNSKEHSDKWIQHDVIEPSSSPWSFAMVAVEVVVGEAAVHLHLAHKAVEADYRHTHHCGRSGTGGSCPWGTATASTG